MKILYPNAIQMPCQHFNARPNGANGIVSLLVIHNISLPAGFFGGDYISALFAGTLDYSAHASFQELVGLNVSAHACIKRDGQVLQYVDFAQRAWHAGVSEFDGVVGCNDFSIGIELEGTDTHPYTDAQYEALSEMTRYLLSQFPMMTTDRIVGHNTIAPGRKTDPGEAFDWSRYLASLS